MNLPTGVLIALTMACVSVAQTMPRAGDIYREYSTDLRSGNSWRVTDPDAAHPGAQDFLPNPVLSMQIDDLDGAVRAELLIDRWGGHPGTSEKRVRFNGNDWLDLPELATTPEDHDPRAYMYEDNPVIDVPLAHLHEGENTFEGTCGDQVVHSFGWGQWGWYGAVLRVYFDADKPHATGRILRDDGTALGEGPIIEVETSGDVDRVDVFAFYEGYDEDGDGEYVGWHGEIRRTELHGHVGTATEAPFRVTWDTRWVPDQPDGQMKLVARVRDSSGMWSVSDVVDGLSLVRDGATVKLYTSSDVPEHFWVRAGRRQQCTVTIPDGADLPRATEAGLFLRTWNGHDYPLRVNEWEDTIGGANHYYALSRRDVPPEELCSGENVIEFHAETEHHGAEILWPGPALIVRYGK